MNENSILSSDEMKRLYGSFYEQTAGVVFDESDVPAEVHLLIPYARFWGLSDDELRDHLVQIAPAGAAVNMKHAVMAFEDELERWLAGSQAPSDAPTEAYVAFSALMMAADLA